MKHPVVSVIMTTYNHAPYLAEAIQSVLNQRCVDFEFLIADDGSTDSTCEIVESFKDNRIQFYPHSTNRGACKRINDLVERATGEFVAIINSDDIWCDPHKLDLQLSIMQDKPELGACFSRVGFIDHLGHRVEKRAMSNGDVFNQPNRSQGKWLRHFFEFGNCLATPSVLIRRQCYEELGKYNNNLRQLPDFEFWIRLLKKYPIYILDSELIKFRIVRGRNTSAPTISNSIRIVNEHFLIAESFFDGVSPKLLKEGFSDLLQYPNIPTSFHLEIEGILLLLSSVGNPENAYKLTGLQKLNRLYASELHQKVLEEFYSIDGLWFQQKSKELGIIVSWMVAFLKQQKLSIKRSAAFLGNFLSKIK